MADKKSSAVDPQRKARKRPKRGQEGQGTVKEFEREGMGVAAKE